MLCKLKLAFFFFFQCATCKLSAIPGAAAGGWILGRYWAQVSPSGLSTAAHGTKEDFSGSASEFCYISSPSALELPERRLWTSGVSLYYHVTSTRTKGKGSKLHQGRFISILGTISSWKGFHWNRLPRAVVGSPSLQRAPKTCSCDAKGHRLVLSWQCWVHGCTPWV